MTTRFELWFNGGDISIIVDAPKTKKDGEEIDGLEDFVEFLSSCEWYYSNGRMIHVRNIDFVTLVKEK